MKSRAGRGREKRKIRRKKSRRERVRRQKMQQMCEKVGKSRSTVFFQWFVAPEGRKVGSLKRRVRSQLARWEMKMCTPLWREAHFEVKRYKTPQRRATFGSWDVEKVHAVVARSTFQSQNVQRHLRVGPRLAVEMLKKCTPLWREAHFQVKMFKTPHVRATFGGSDVEKVHAVVARSTFPSQNVQSTTCSRHFWRFRCRFASLHYVTLHYTPLRYTTLHYTTFQYTTLHYTTLQYTTLITLYYTIFHYTSLPYTTLHSIPLQIQLQLQLKLQLQLHSTTLRYTKLHYTTLLILHYTTLHYTTLHYITLQYTTLPHYIPLHSTTPHYITPHFITMNDAAPQIDR